MRAEGLIVATNVMISCIFVRLGCWHGDVLINLYVRLNFLCSCGVDTFDI